MYKRFRYCWQDICIDDTVTSFPEEEELMGFVPEDSGLAGDSGFFGDSLGWMQTNGTQPPGGEPHYCTFYDTVLTWYIVANGKVLAEYDGLTKALHYKYIYAGDQRVAMRDGVNRLHYYLNDHLGSARVVIDSTGTIKDKYHYLAYGSPLDVTFSTGQPYDMDAGMNLYYYGARYYDGDGGRFTQVDPLRNKYPEWGAYVYALDNPIANIDPTGMASARGLDPKEKEQEEARQDAAASTGVPVAVQQVNQSLNEAQTSTVTAVGNAGQQVGQVGQQVGQAVVQTADQVKPVATGVGIAAAAVGVVTTAPAWGTVAAAAGLVALGAQAVKTIDNPSSANLAETGVDAATMGLGAAVSAARPLSKLVRAGRLSTSEARVAGVLGVALEATTSAAAASTVRHALNRSPDWQNARK